MSNSGFNPKSRWDRHVPGTGDTFDTGQLNERIQVLAWFKNGKILPELFVWNNKEYKIEKITYNWQERRGQEIINYFSVNTNPDLYQISFNNTTCSWKIDKVIE